MSMSHENELIVISGASTGLGAATARALADRGFYVLAGVRREQDGQPLRREGLEPVILDVTNLEDIAGLVTRIDELGRPLRAVVNNAGYAANAPVEALPLESWRKVFEVNVFGAIALTQALLPALRRSKGRVVNISSIGGRVSMPAFGAYSGSKYAIEAISDSLRQEVAGQGVQVVIVEPGGMRTEMGARGRDTANELLAEMSPEHRELYDPAMQRFITYTGTFDDTGATAEHAASIVIKAVTDRRPRIRYTIGRDAAIMTRMVRIMPARTMDRMIASTLNSAAKNN